MNVDLREFRAAFVAEAEEHLAAIQSLLLDIERAARGGAASPRALRETMRLLHTIKGLSAMVGVEPIVQLAHKMETVVRAAERAGGRLDERAVEVMLAGTRAVSASIRAVEANRTPPSPAADLIRELDALEEPAPASAAEIPLDPLLGAKLGASERQQLSAGARAGRRAVRVDFAPSPERAARGLTITSVRDRLGAIAEIVKVLPLNLPAVGGTGGLVFALLLLTDASDEAIADAVGGSPVDVTVLIAPPAEESSPRALRATAIEDDDLVDGGRGVLRVEVSRVDDAIDMLGSLVVTRSRMQHALERLEGTGADTRELRTILGDNARQLRELRSAILRVRMVPMTALLDRLPLVVRGLARTSGKQVQIALDVGSAELDKTVAERLFPALVHLVRNAVDHGIETPDERLAASKPPSARLSIRSVSGDRSVEVRISDDGRGIDRAAVATRAGIPPPATEAALLELLCRPGLSTRAEVNETSGRGMGMDIVKKTVVHRLGGDLSLETAPGRGTTFVLRVPLTVAIVEAFTIRCDGERYAVPVPIVEEILELSQERVVTGPRSASGAAQRLLARRGATVPLFDLGGALGTRRTDAPAGQVLVVRAGQGELAAYAVERVLGQQEIVVRPLADPLVASPAIAGATDLGDGRVTVVLDLLALSMSAGSEHAA